MTIKVKLETISNSIQALNAAGTTAGLPIKASYQIGRILEKVSKELQALEKARIAKLEELAEKDESGKPLMKELKDQSGKPIVRNGEPIKQYDLSEENFAIYEKEYQELLANEIELYGNPIPLDNLGSNANFLPETLSNLSWLITDEPGKAEK